MSNLFFILSLLSLIFLILGLINPKLVSKFFKKDLSRKTILKIFGSSLIIFIIALGVASPKSVDNNKVTDTKQKQEAVLSSVDYSIISEEDISYKETKRYNVRVVITNNPATKDQIKTVSEKIVNDYKSKGIDALAIFYYFDETQVDGAYTLAKADWAPNGDWSQASLKTNQKLIYQFANLIDIERTNAPTALEREINKSMRDKWYELAEKNNSLVTDEDVAKILAPQYNKTIEEMLEIRMRVTDYDLGL